MIFMAVQGKLPLSRLIRWGLKSEASHFVAGFGARTAIHSNISGVNLEYFPYVVNKYHIVKTAEVPLSLKDEDEVFEAMLGAGYKKPYDFKAFAYWVIAVLKNRLFGKPFPKTNAWNEEGKYLCVGMAYTMPKWLVGDLSEREAEMMAPMALVEHIEKRLADGLIDRVVKNG